MLATQRMENWALQYHRKDVLAMMFTKFLRHCYVAWQLWGVAIRLQFLDHSPWLIHVLCHLERLWRSATTSHFTSISFHSFLLPSPQRPGSARGQGCRVSSRYAALSRPEYHRSAIWSLTERIRLVGSFMSRDLGMRQSNVAERLEKLIPYI